MFKFIDGQPTVLTFEQVESLYYQAFVGRFPESAVSITQWRGSYEYQAMYPEIQLMVENGAIMSDSLNHVMGTIAAENQRIYRPAALHTRVPERFAQEGIEATIRQATLETRGIVAICVDQKTTPDSFIGDLIRDEMLPAGQFMEGDITYPTAISNGQPITIKWTHPVELTATFRTTITRSRNTPYPIDSPDQVVEIFNAAYARIMGLGLDIVPDKYLTTVNLPWAAAIVTECDPLGGTAFSPNIVLANFNQRYAGVMTAENVIIN